MTTLIRVLDSLVDGNWYLCNGCDEPASKQFSGGLCETCSTIKTFQK
jgi:hypothetical protein